MLIFRFFKEMDPCIPIPIPDVKLEELVEKAKDFALMHGNKVTK